MNVEEKILSEVNSAAAETEAPSETPEDISTDSEVEIEPEEQIIEDSPKQDFYKQQYENLQKDYTRKAQELAELKKSNVSEPKAEDPEWTKPDWQPKTWQEAIEAGKQAALKEVAPALSEYEQARKQREAHIKAQQIVSAELAEIKATHPKVDENLIFQHANKYGFSSLKTAYQNLVDMQGLEKTVQQRVLKNLKARQSDPVGMSGATTPDDDTPTYGEITSYKSIRSAASAALAHLKGK